MLSVFKRILIDYCIYTPLKKDLINIAISCYKTFSIILVYHHGMFIPLSFLKCNFVVHACIRTFFPSPFPSFNPFFLTIFHFFHTSFLRSLLPSSIPPRRTQTCSITIPYYALHYTFISALLYYIWQLILITRPAITCVTTDVVSIVRTATHIHVKPT